MGRPLAHVWPAFVYLDTNGGRIIKPTLSDYLTSIKSAFLNRPRMSSSQRLYGVSKLTENQHSTGYRAYQRMEPRHNGTQFVLNKSSVHTLVTQQHLAVERKYPECRKTRRGKPRVRGRDLTRRLLVARFAVNAENHPNRNLVYTIMLISLYISRDQ